jgi:U3 small nucleolar RNA-associated protein 19
LTDAPSDPNPLLGMLALARNPSAEVVHKAVWALYRVFGAQIAAGRVGGITGTGEPEVRAISGKEAKDGGAREVKGWVRDRLLEFVEILGGLLRDTEAGLRSSALKVLFGLLPPLSAAAGVPYHTAYFRILLRHMLAPTPSLRGARPAAATSSSSARWATVAANQEGEDGVLPPEIAAEAVDEFWAKYDDLRIFFFRETAAYIAANEGVDADNVLNMVIYLTNLPKTQADLNGFFIPGLADAPAKEGVKGKKAKSTTKGKKGKATDELPDWMETYESEGSDDEGAAVGGKRVRTGALGTHAAVHSLAAHTAAYTTLWETVLSRFALEPSWVRRILAGLHGERGILTHWAPARRVRLADWLGETVDGGGAHAMLAMNGLFVLMTTYNLDYPNFYERLYALLDANVLHARYRARFFRLLDTFLRSPLLPAALIAAFIKRLARLSLTAPPAGAILVIPFVYNLFKRHPGTMLMLQRQPEDMETDLYNPSEAKPIASRAIDSSVWELAALQHHYLAAISTLAKVFTEQFTKPEFNLEDFLDHGYGTLFDTEAQRKIRNAPALSVALDLGQSIELFPAPSAAGERDAVSELWAF